MNQRSSFFKGAGQKQDDGIIQRTIEISRVTRVQRGGKVLRFRACVVVGDQKGTIGVAVRKGKDVSVAITKAQTSAKNTMTHIQLKDGSIPHDITMKFGAARILLRPSRKGIGVRAGGSVRAVLEVCGVQDIIGKMLGSHNKINNAYATLFALKKIRLQ